jgi:hypothetical protein
MATRVFRIAVLVAGCTVLMAGCGRMYTVMDRVVQMEPNLEVGIHEVGSLQELRVGNPVSDATVVLYHALDNEGNPMRDSSWQRQVQVDRDGSFEIHDYAKPSSEEIQGIEVSAPGWATQYTTYVDYYDPDEQFFLVVLPAVNLSHDKVSGG